MLPTALHAVDLPGVESAVGAASYARGVQYARQRAVVRVRWDPSENALYGTVHGRAGDFYTTAAYFSVPNGLSPELEQGHCDCPVGFNCEHVVALVLTAMGAEQPRSVLARGQRRPAWEQSLGSLLESRQAAAASRTGGAPLAIELTLSAAPARNSAVTGSAVRLMARLVTPGKNGWVSGGLSWTKLGSLHYYGDYLASHVRLLQEMYAVYRSRHNRSDYYSYEEKSIDLSAFESCQLWRMLDEADAIGLRVVHGKKRLGAVEKYRSAQFCLDITSSEPSGMLVITPVIRVDGTQVDAAPIRFIGAEGHGLVYIDRAEVCAIADHGNWHLRLAKLTTTVPPQMQRMALENQHLEIPAGEQSRFRDEYYPRLRHMAALISSDETFTPPTISDPTLVLRTSYGAQHDLEISWEWAYDVDGSRLRTPLHPTPSDIAYRDLDAELTVLANLDIPLDRFGPLRADPERADPDQTLAPHAALRGIDTMRFTTEVLPLLADRPGIMVEVSGKPADYREAGDSLSIGVSTDDLVGETDWFDLGVTITVEGQEVPFADVFVALSSDQHAARQRRLLLPAEARTGGFAEADRGSTGAA